jgi:hypothetical protein
MDFNATIKKILEDFTAPTDTKRPVKVRPSGKFGTGNPQLNEPHSTNSISGFKGQPGGRQHTLKFPLPGGEEDISKGITTRWQDGGIDISLIDILKYLEKEPVIDIEPEKLKHALIKVKRDPARVQAADLNYPLVVTKVNGKFKKILDGQHRLVKAITNKEPTVKIKVLDINSAPDDYKEMFS